MHDDFGLPVQHGLPVAFDVVVLMRTPMMQDLSADQVVSLVSCTVWQEMAEAGQKVREDMTGPFGALQEAARAVGKVSRSCRCPCSVIECPALHLPCPALPCPTLPCPALPCPALPCPALPCPALLHSAISVLLRHRRPALPCPSLLMQSC